MCAIPHRSFVGFILYPKFSPDGKKAAVFWNRSDKKELLWVIDLGSGRQDGVSNLGLFPQGWSANGDDIYCLTNDLTSLLRVSVESGHPVNIFNSFGKIQWVDVDPLGPKFVLSIAEIKSDVWVMENFDPHVR